MTKKSIHMSICPDLMEKLREHASRNHKSMNRVVEEAIEALINQSKTPTINIKKAIESIFIFPSNNFTEYSFFTVLYMLSQKYPNESSSSFWGKDRYIANTELTHKQVFDLIYPKITVRKAS